MDSVVETPNNGFLFNFWRMLLFTTTRVW